MKKMALYILLLASCPNLLSVNSQVLPDLPDFPSPSPAKSPKPLPSALQDIVDEANESVQPTAVAPNKPPPASTNAPTSTATGTAVPEQPQPSITPVQPSPSAPIAVPSATPAVTVDEEGRCIRDPLNPKPTLGKSQLRYAVSVLLSAAAVALASMFYGLASDWEPSIDHAFARLCFILLARLLIIGAVKVSAALVASITKASPDDGALDASGAFLTWGSAIFTRLYYEGLKMTMAALEFIQNEAIWDDKLKEFLSEGYINHVSRSSLDDLVDIQLVDEEEGISAKKLHLHQRLFGGRTERKLLFITALLYFASEISTLTANVMSLVGAFIENANQINFFSSEIGGLTCFTKFDIPVMGGLITLQVIYSVAQQPSLVPILTISAFCNDCEKYPTINSILKKLRWIACFILFSWVVSLLVLPLFGPQLQAFFTSGDISLFWYVIIAPPSYQATSYIITAVYACFAALAGFFIIYGISKSQRQE